MFKGREAVNEILRKTNMELMKIDDGSSKLVRFLVTVDDVLCVYEHTEQFSGNWKTITCLDKNYNRNGDCPLCLAGKKASVKAYFPVIDRGDENKVKIIKASKEMLRQISGLEDEYGAITDRDFKISRSGKSLQTKYQFFPKDVKKEDLTVYEIPDIEDRMKPMSREGILELMHRHSAGAATSELEQVAQTVENDGEAGYPFYT